MGSYAMYPPKPIEMCPVCRKDAHLQVSDSLSNRLVCSIRCLKRLAMRIRNGLASVMHYRTVYSASAPAVNTDHLRRRIKHLEAQLRAAGQIPRRTPLDVAVKEGC